MIAKEEISRIKEDIRIVDYLASLGYEPVKQSKAQWKYHSPFRSESTASFYVHLDKNRFKDFGIDNKGGDVIQLAQLLHKLTFAEAVNQLKDYVPGKIPQTTLLPRQGDKPQRSNDYIIKILEVKPLEHSALVSYAEYRKIPFLLAAKYLGEVHYQLGDRSYFALGFRNDAGGYELRNRYFKSCSSPKSFSSFTGRGYDTVCLFEGFFDFLSAMVHFQTDKPRFDTIVLNSTSNLKSALPMLRRYKKINLFLDNDKAGEDAIKRLEKEGLPICNCNRFYSGHNDFNAYIMDQE